MIEPISNESAGQPELPPAESEVSTTASVSVASSTSVNGNRFDDIISGQFDADEELPELTAGRHFDLVQAPLNILDRSLVDSGWAKRLKEQGTELIKSRVWR